MRTGHKVRNNLPHTLLTASVFLNTPAHSTQKFLAGHSARPSTVSMKRWYCPLSLKCWKPLQNTVQWAGTIRQALWALRRDWRSGTKPHGADRAVTGRAKRRDRATKSQKPNGMGAADERLQGTGRGDCESGIDLWLSEKVRAENCSGFSHIFQSCGRIVHKFYGII